MKLKKAPRTKWRFVRGPKYAYAKYVSALEVLRRFFVDGLIVNTDSTTMDILRVFGQMIERLNELECTVYKLSYIKDILEAERAIASDNKNELLTMLFEDATKSFEHGGACDAVFDLCSSIKMLDKFDRLKESDKP